MRRVVVSTHLRVHPPFPLMADHRGFMCEGQDALWKVRRNNLRRAPFQLRLSTQKSGFIVYLRLRQRVSNRRQTSAELVVVLSYHKFTLRDIRREGQCVDIGNVFRGREEILFVFEKFTLGRPRVCQKVPDGFQVLTGLRLHKHRVQLLIRRVGIDYIQKSLSG